MTQHWADIDNASLLVVWGANPVENHPAVAAHMNAARYGSKKAKLIVIDPRLTRTARQINPDRKDIDGIADPDFYVRIRPGTDIAFGNGVLNWIFNNGATYKSGTAWNNLMAWHNGTDVNFISAGRTFIDDAGVTRTITSAELYTAGTPNKYAKYDGVDAPGFKSVVTATKQDGSQDATNTVLAGYPKYCDSRFLINAAGTDYVRAALTTVSNTGTGAWKFTNFPVIADTVDSSAGMTVWKALKAHVGAYDLATVAGICGCSQNDIIAVAKAFIDHSRFNSSDWNRPAATPHASTYKATTILYAMGQTQHTCGSQNIKNFAVIQTLLGNMGRSGGGINALRGIHNVQGSTDMGVLFDSIPAYSANPGVDEHYDHYLDALFGNRLKPSATGTTAAAAASVNMVCAGANNDLTFTAKAAGVGGNSISVTYVDPAAASQTLSVAVTGTDIVVNLATDGTGAITTTAAQLIAAIAADASANALVGVAASGTDTTAGVVTAKAKTFLASGFDAGSDFTTVPAKMGLQQRGFANMTNEWFGNGSSSGADIALLYDLWPKGNGIQHIQTFRNMTYADSHVDANGMGDRIRAAVVWGQNPCISEPNQTAVRAGLKALDLLVCVDMFLNETAACDRKSIAGGDAADGITYLLPACSHVEEAGSVTNSGRWLQWRERATKPFGDSKSDLELMLRLAKALDDAGAFSHIITRWSTLGAPITPSVANRAYTELFGKYGYTPNGTPGTFEALSATSETWRYGDSGPVNRTVYGSDVVAENLYKEICRPLNTLADGTASSKTGGTMWIYSGSDTGNVYAGLTATPGVGGWNGGASWNGNYMPAVTSTGNTVAWQVKNRAKSRNSKVSGHYDTTLSDPNLYNALDYPRWGWSWLLNRRVFYNNSEIKSDQGDTFVSPGVVCCMFTIDYTSTNTLADWSGVYRKYKQFNDRPSAVGVGSPHITGGVVYAGQFPGHTEPYESPRTDLRNKWGVNTSKGSPLVLASTPYVDGTVVPVTSDMLVLTTIRCVEHFQGGPITRNNSWNLEAEPVPWIEINSVDAAKNSIKDGDWVNVITVRSNTKLNQPGLSPNADAGWSQGFRARVGVGLESNQRVAPGVVAIPWHWGEKGLGTGSRANDHCIDAWDANTMIPEYKACLCKIEKM